MLRQIGGLLSSSWSVPRSRGIYTLKAFTERQVRRSAQTG